MCLLFFSRVLGLDINKLKSAFWVRIDRLFTEDQSDCAPTPQDFDFLTTTVDVMGFDENGLGLRSSKRLYRRYSRLDVQFSRLDVQYSR